MRSAEQNLREIVGEHVLSSASDKDQRLEEQLAAVDVSTSSRDTLQNLLRYISRLDIRPNLTLTTARALCLHPDVQPGDNLGIVLTGPLLELVNPALAAVPLPTPPGCEQDAARLAGEDFWTLYNVCSTASPSLARSLAAELQKGYLTPPLLFLLDKLEAQNSGTNRTHVETSAPYIETQPPVEQIETLDIREPQFIPDNGLHPVYDESTGLQHISDSDTLSGLQVAPSKSSGLQVVPRKDRPPSAYDGIEPVSIPKAIEPYVPPNDTIKSRFFRRDKAPRPVRISLSLPSEKSVTLSPDCKHALIWTKWQIALVETGKKMHTPVAVPNVVMATMSDNCVAMVRRTAADELLCYRLRNIADLQPFLQLVRRPITCIALSPSGSWLAVGYNGFVEVHNFASIAELRTYPITGECIGLSFDNKELLICTRSGDQTFVSTCPHPYTKMYPLTSVPARGPALRMGKDLVMEDQVLSEGVITSLDLGPVYMNLIDGESIVTILRDGTVYHVGKGKLATLPRLNSRHSQFAATQVLDAKIKDGYLRIAVVSSVCLDIASIALRA